MPASGESHIQGREKAKHGLFSLAISWCWSHVPCTFPIPSLLAGVNCFQGIICFAWSLPCGHVQPPYQERSVADSEVQSCVSLLLLPPSPSLSVSSQRLGPGRRSSLWSPEGMRYVAIWDTFYNGDCVEHGALWATLCVCCKPILHVLYSSEKYRYLYLYAVGASEICQQWQWACEDS